MKAEFISRVMQIMNELGWNDAGSDVFIGSDVAKVERHIESVFVDAWRKAVNLLPKTYFEIEDFSSRPLVGNMHTGTGYVLLPDDFYALYSFRMSGWQKAAETLVESSDPLAAIQSNEYTRGNFVRPVCVGGVKPFNERMGDDIVPTLKGVLEYYSLPRGSAHRVSEALYVPLLAPLGDDTKLSGRLYTPLAYLCAGLVFDIFEKPDAAKMLESKAIEIIK